MSTAFCRLEKPFRIRQAVKKGSPFLFPVLSCLQGPLIPCAEAVFPLRRRASIRPSTGLRPISIAPAQELLHQSLAQPDAGSRSSGLCRLCGSRRTSWRAPPIPRWRLGRKPRPVQRRRQNGQARAEVPSFSKAPCHRAYFLAVMPNCPMRRYRVARLIPSSEAACFFPSVCCP